MSVKNKNNLLLLTLNSSVEIISQDLLNYRDLNQANNCLIVFAKFWLLKCIGQTATDTKIELYLLKDIITQIRNREVIYIDILYISTVTNNL